MNEEVTKFEVGLIGGADLNLQEVGVLLENICLEYYSTPNIDLGKKNTLSKQYTDLAIHYNKILGDNIITTKVEYL